MNINILSKKFFIVPLTLCLVIRCNINKELNMNNGNYSIKKFNYKIKKHKKNILSNEKNKNHAYLNKKNHKLSPLRILYKKSFFSKEAKDLDLKKWLLLLFLMGQIDQADANFWKPFKKKATKFYHKSNKALKKIASDSVELEVWAAATSKSIKGDLVGAVKDIEDEGETYITYATRFVNSAEQTIGEWEYSAGSKLSEAGDVLVHDVESITKTILLSFIPQDSRRRLQNNAEQVLNITFGEDLSNTSLQTIKSVVSPKLVYLTLSDIEAGEGIKSVVAIDILNQTDIKIHELGGSAFLGDSIGLCINVIDELINKTSVVVAILEGENFNRTSLSLRFFDNMDDDKCERIFGRNLRNNITLVNNTFLDIAGIHNNSEAYYSRLNYTDMDSPSLVFKNLIILPDYKIISLKSNIAEGRFYISAIFKNLIYDDYQLALVEYNKNGLILRHSVFNVPENSKINDLEIFRNILVISLKDKIGGVIYTSDINKLDEIFETRLENKYNKYIFEPIHGRCLNFTNDSFVVGICGCREELNSNVTKSFYIKIPFSNEGIYLGGKTKELTLIGGDTNLSYIGHHWVMDKSTSLIRTFHESEDENGLFPVTELGLNSDGLPDEGCGSIAKMESIKIKKDVIQKNNFTCEFPEEEDETKQFNMSVFDQSGILSNETSCENIEFATTKLIHDQSTKYINIDTDGINSKSDDSDAWILAPIIVGAILGCCLLLLICHCLKRIFCKVRKYQEIEETNF